MVLGKIPVPGRPTIRLVRSGGAMILGKLSVAGRPTIWMIVVQGPIALAVGAGGVCLDIFTLLYHFSSLSPTLWDTARYRLKCCLKGPLNPKQPTNQLYQVVYQRGRKKREKIDERRNVKTTPTQYVQGSSVSIFEKNFLTRLNQ